MSRRREERDELRVPFGVRIGLLGLLRHPALSPGIKYAGSGVQLQGGRAYAERGQTVPVRIACSMGWSRLQSRLTPQDWREAGRPAVPTGWASGTALHVKHRAAVGGRRQCVGASKLCRDSLALDRILPARMLQHAAQATAPGLAGVDLPRCRRRSREQGDWACRQRQGGRRPCGPVRRRPAPSRWRIRHELQRQASER